MNSFCTCNGAQKPKKKQSYIYNQIFPVLHQISVIRMFIRLCAFVYSKAGNAWMCVWVCQRRFAFRYFSLSSGTLWDALC